MDNRLCEHREEGNKLKTYSRKRKLTIKTEAEETVTETSNNNPVSLPKNNAQNNVRTYSRKKGHIVAQDTVKVEVSEENTMVIKVEPLFLRD